MARRVIKFALSKKAEDVLLLDLRKITTMTDFFVVCSGTSDVQIKAIADAVREGCGKEDIEIYNVEGYESLRWVLIDLVDVVVHIFHPDVRNYYRLERLWGDAERERFSSEGEESLS
ncbi:MAG: ribosome silencing factor [Candidatus Latescibacteria bacterium]|nr:ribosome silencing factor [Candidatus Latescibacterota bacterium]NIO01009.1 ribosome silencing factor [Candidatus Latescibacterota bacterium]NIO27408.1 ribosome silencing factor [Candidatus Latescibacterota bacterium]NIO54930.1 ribosome silencing factor [Candidatus Latescibacterota bacterium]NIT01019.1 ribosome silencing factor [Candidatus Latescibacterota bacterium]